MEKAWISVCERLKLKDEERVSFESHAKEGFTEYLEALSGACELHQQARRNISKWFEPLFKVVELFTPAAAVAVQAWPNPGSLVLGGIVGIVQITQRYQNYQRSALKVLARMGAKAPMLLQQEVNLYKREPSVQTALLLVYEDIIAFCVKAFRRVKEETAKVVGRAMILFKDFESAFGEIVRNFEEHLEMVQDRALIVNTRWQMEIRKGQDVHTELLKGVGETVGRIERHAERTQEQFAECLSRELIMLDSTQLQDKFSFAAD